MLKKALKLFLLNKVVILIFILSLFLRTLLLDKFPVGIVHDELNYVLNAKSLFYTGKNIPLTASSLFSWGEKNWDVVISEIPSYIIAPWIGPNVLNQFNVRLPYAVVSSLSVVFLFLIVKLLLNEQIAGFAALIMAVNPWSIHFGRTALEVTFASFFFLTGTYIFLKAHSWKIFWSYPLLLAGFMSYLGAKLHFFPLIIILIIYKFFTTKIDNHKKALIVFGVLALITLLFYTTTMKFQPAGDRKGELIIYKTDWATDQVNTERKQSIVNPFLDVFSNKATVIIKRIVDFYISGFNTAPLFVKGDVVSIYSLWQHGQFFYIDLPLIIIGLVVLFSINKKVFWLSLAIIALGPTVSSIDLVEQTYPVRAFPMFPYLCLLSGLGLWFIKEKVKFGKIIFSIFSIIYFISILNFLYLYFYRYPVYSAERWFFSERIVSKYASLLRDDPRVEKIFVATGENPKNVFEEYLFFSGRYNTKTDIILVNSNLENKIFTSDKVVFNGSCPKKVDFSNREILIFDRRLNCLHEEKEDKGILALVDAGTVFVIKGDKLCQNVSLPRYYRAMNFNQFKIESLSVQEFCKTWITQL